MLFSILGKFKTNPVTVLLVKSLAAHLWICPPAFWFRKLRAVIMANEQEVAAVGRILANPQENLTARFRALFTLRNLGGAQAVDWISKAFVDESALLKHELAYCLGQMQDERAIPALEAVLKDTSQEPMVRHEAGKQTMSILCSICLSVAGNY